MWGILVTLILLCSCTGQIEEQGSSRRATKAQQSAPSPSWLTKSYLLGQFDPPRHPLFDRIPVGLAERPNMYLRREALAALLEMADAAGRDSVRFLVRSATRNFNRQKQIWESKWRGDRLLEGREQAPKVYPRPYDRAKAILRWSSMPGSSRHHWGTDVDFNAFDNAYFEHGSGKRFYSWMLAHASTYGFCQPYTRRDSLRPVGYNEERWHWSYRPVAAICLKAYRDSIGYADFKNFLGYEMADSVRIIDDYVLGVNRGCY